MKEIKKDKDIYYRLIGEIEECDKKETKEILDVISNLNKDDLEIVEVEDVTINF